MKDLSIDITMPLLNEEKRLEKGVSRTIEFLRNSIIERYRITLADNGSFDRTEEIAKSIEKRYPQVRYIKLEKVGVGLALKESWGRSDYDIVGYMDVDLATDIKHIIDVYYAMQKDIDVVNGSRIVPGSNTVNRSMIREITSRAFNLILRSALNVKFTDGMCGFKFIKKESYDKLSRLGLDDNDWFFCSEMLVKAEWLGLKICEIPIYWRDDGDSRVNILKTTYRYMKGITNLYLNKRSKRLWARKNISIL